jgi:lipoprotein-anchoring transpeptidase ErfK/SrfK
VIAAILVILLGGFVSYGCIRMLNDDITDLYRRVSVGTTVVVTH